MPLGPDSSKSWYLGTLTRSELLFLDQPYLSNQFTMSTRRKQIASIVQALPGAVFQELAEDYIQLKHPEYQSINPSGSSEIEQKTTVGHPDTLFWLPSGVPVFVEATVKKKGVVAKLKEDIAECAKLKIELKVPQNESPVLYLCYARKFKPKQDKELIDYGTSLGLIIVLVGLTQISMDIELRFPELARNYCHLPFDSGQTMSITEFVGKHGIKNNKLTTALDNVVTGGEERVNEVKSRLNESEVVIVSGPKGVGKTRFEPWQSRVTDCKLFLVANPHYI